MPEPEAKNHVENTALRVVVPLVKGMKGINIQTSLLLPPISCQSVLLAEPYQKREVRGPDEVFCTGQPLRHRAGQKVWTVSESGAKKKGLQHIKSSFKSSLALLIHSLPMIIILLCNLLTLTPASKLRIDSCFVCCCLPSRCYSVWNLFPVLFPCI